MCAATESDMNWVLLLVIITYLVLVGFPLIMCHVDDKQYFGWLHAAGDEVLLTRMPRMAATARDAEVAKFPWHGDASDLARADLTDQRVDIGDELLAVGLRNRLGEIEQFVQRFISESERHSGDSVASSANRAISALGARIWVRSRAMADVVLRGKLVTGGPSLQPTSAQVILRHSPPPYTSDFAVAKASIAQSSTEPFSLCAFCSGSICAIAVPVLRTSGDSAPRSARRSCDRRRTRRMRIAGSVSTSIRE
jgi:hypothetical protein